MSLVKKNPWVKTCLGNESSHFFKEYLENVFYRMLSWRKVQAGVPSPSHFSKVLLVFSKPGTVRVLFTRTLLPTLSLRLERCRTLGTGFEFLQLLWSPRLPPSGSGKKGSLLTCGVSEGTLLSTCPPGELHLPACPRSGCHRRAAGGANFSWISPPGGKGMEGLNPASRKFPEQKQVPSTLSCGVWTSAGAVTEHRSLF